MEQPTFTISEIVCIEDAVKNFKVTHGKYCDEDGLNEIDDILRKLLQYRVDESAHLGAFHYLASRKYEKY